MDAERNIRSATGCRTVHKYAHAQCIQHCTPCTLTSFATKQNEVEIVTSPRWSSGLMTLFLIEEGHGIAFCNEAGRIFHQKWIVANGDACILKLLMNCIKPMLSQCYKVMCATSSTSSSSTLLSLPCARCASKTVYIRKALKSTTHFHFI